MKTRVRYALPRAGQLFPLEIEPLDLTSPKSPVAFRLELQSPAGGGAMLADGDCPDPPCHERFAIPPDAAGSRLLVNLARADLGLVADAPQGADSTGTLYRLDLKVGEHWDPELWEQHDW